MANRVFRFTLLRQLQNAVSGHAGGILRKHCDPVTEAERRSPEFHRMLRDMIHTMRGQGVGLAAPQVGHAKRIFVADLSRKWQPNAQRSDCLACDVSALAPHHRMLEEVMDPMPVDASDNGVSLLKLYRPLIMINPTIVEKGSFFNRLGEGCLSLPNLVVSVRRADKISVRFETIDGELVELGLSGFDARIFQHEHDHLDGRLIIDYATHDGELLIEEFQGGEIAPYASEDEFVSSSSHE